jgi:hypothetical protein
LFVFNIEKLTKRDFLDIKGKKLEKIKQCVEAIEGEEAITVYLNFENGDKVTTEGFVPSRSCESAAVSIVQESTEDTVATEPQHSSGHANVFYPDSQ